MKLVAILILTSITITGYAQELNCCQSTEQIQSAIQGDWTLKKVEHQSLFTFSFIDNHMSCNIKQEFEESSPSKILSHDAKLIVQKDDLGYLLQWQTKLFRWDARILKLKSRKIVLEINGSQLILKKAKDKV